MAQKDSLTQKTGVVVFARIINTVVDLALVVVVVHILSKTEFAVIGYLLMVHEIARNLATIGFPESIFYYFERITKSARKAFVLQTVAILIALAAVAGILILIVGFFAHVLLSGWQISTIFTVQNLLPLMAVVTFLEVPSWPTTNILLASDRQKTASWYEIATSSITFIVVAGPLLAGYSITAAVYGLVGYAAIRFIGSAVLLQIVLPKRVEKNQIYHSESSSIFQYR